MGFVLPELGPGHQQGDHHHPAPEANQRAEDASKEADHKTNHAVQSTRIAYTSRKRSRYTNSASPRATYVDRRLVPP